MVSRPAPATVQRRGLQHVPRQSHKGQQDTTIAREGREGKTEGEREGGRVGGEWEGRWEEGREGGREREWEEERGRKDEGGSISCNTLGSVPPTPTYCL